MNIVFYKIKDDKRTLNKTINSTTKVKELTGNIKTDCDIMNPELETSYHTEIMTANYMYIAAFSRYYFIDKITVSAQRLYIQAHVDVLTTYKTDIVKLRCVIERQQDKNKCSMYVPDKAFKAESRKIVSIRQLSNKFYKASNSSYILTTGGPS